MQGVKRTLIDCASDYQFIRPVTLTELRYIAAVARENHFGRAAAACFVSQPTLSVAIRKLEEELGVSLFERNRSHVALTPIGEKIIEQARCVLDEAEQIKTIASAEQDQLASPLKLGVIYTIGAYLVPHLIPGLKKNAANMQLLITENFTDALVPQLKNGEIDAAILSLPFSAGGIVTRELYVEEFVVALPKGHALAAKAELTANDLVEETMLLLGARNCFRDQVLDYCPACATTNEDGDRDIQQTLESSSIETIRQMTAAGAGITLLPISSATHESSLSGLLDVRPFAAPKPTRTVALAYRRSFPRPQAINVMVEAIRDAPPVGVELVDF